MVPRIEGNPPSEPPLKEEMVSPLELEGWVELDPSAEGLLRKPRSPWESGSSQEERGDGSRSGNLTKPPSAAFAHLRGFGEGEVEVESHHQPPYSRYAQTLEFRPQSRCW